MNILLINPAYGNFKNKPWKSIFSSPPVGLTFLAGVILDKGHNVKIIDAFSLGLSNIKVIDYVKEFQPHIVGLYVQTVQVEDTLLLCENIKQVAKNVKIIIGGPHCTSMPEEFHLNKFIDYICIGEGEETISSLIDALENGQDVSQVPNLVYKDSHDHVITNHRKGFITDLDALPRPAYHLLPYKEYSLRLFVGLKGQVMTMNTIRGCPFNCSFCDVHRLHGHKVRCYSPEKVVEEISYLNKELGILAFQFNESIFTILKERNYQICNLILQKGLKIKWSCNSRIDTLPDIEGLKLMKRAGCKKIFLGIESGDPEILKREKKLTIEKILATLQLLRKVGIDYHCSFVLGLDGETVGTIKSTIDFSILTKADTVSFNIAVPFPGTLLYDSLNKKDKIITKDWSKYRSTEVVFKHENLTSTQLKQMLRKAFRTFYFQPRYILYRISKIKSFKELLYLMKIASNMLFNKIIHKL